MKQRILIVEDQKLFRQMLYRELEQEYEVFECVTGEQALDILPKFTPDLIVLDLVLPGISGLDLIEEMNRKSKAPVVILTANEDEAFIKALFPKVIENYWLKNYEELTELIRRIEIILSGKKADVPNYLIKKLYYSVKEALTRAELKVYMLMVRGYSSAQIAAKLFISVFTVHNHRKKVLGKLDAKSTIELILRKAG